MRKLKHHQGKLLRRVNFYDWKGEDDKREGRVIHRYHLQDRQDYSYYNRICGLITSLLSKIKQLPFDDPFRLKATQQLLDKLHRMGLVSSPEDISAAEKVSVSAFCRRRLAVMLCSLKFAETMREAVSFVEAGHVRVGAEVVTDPALLVGREWEDQVGWVDTSSIKRKILSYKEALDDYDMIN